MSAVIPIVTRKMWDSMVRDDRCPKCGGELDTGYECTDCGFDAKPLMHKFLTRADQTEAGG